MESTTPSPADTPADATAPQRPWFSPHSRRTLALACLLTALWMGVQQRAELLGRPDPPVAILLRFGIAIAYLEWMFTDARLRGEPFSGGGKLAMACVAPISVPCYILWTRRWRGLFVGFATVLALYAAAIAGGVIAVLVWGGPFFE